MKKISIIIPAFNENENLQSVHDRLSMVFSKLPYRYEIIFVNDGSVDGTQVKLEELSGQHHLIKFIELSRNFGGQVALKAGIDHAEADAVIMLDADLQHPPELIPQMLMQWENGYEVVNMCRTYASETSLFKRKTSDYFYQLLNRISDIEMKKGESDFKLLDKVVVNTIKNFNEDSLFLRGVFKWIGFRQISIPYKAGIRNSGNSSYDFKKLVKLGVSGVTSFSERPLHIAAYLGFIFTLLAVLFFIWDVADSIVNGKAIAGWPSIIVTIVFFGGMQLSILGIMGLYLGKIFKQIKDRPNYIIRNKNF